MGPKQPLTSSDQPGPDEPVVMVQRVTHERNRTWCMIGTFVICLLVLTFSFVLGLQGRTMETFAAGGAGIGVLGLWQWLVRYYFPASINPPPTDDRKRRLALAEDDNAAA